MVGLGEAHGVRTAALQTAMDTVLGRAAGNGLEVTESVEVLAGGGPADLVEVTVALAREMLALAGRRRATILPTSSRRAAPCRCGARWSPPRAATPTLASRPRRRSSVHAHRSGMLDPARRARGRRARGGSVPAGPARKTRSRPSAGVVCRVKPGDASPRVTSSSSSTSKIPLGTRRADALDDAYDIGDRAPPAVTLVLDRIG